MLTQKIRIIAKGSGGFSLVSTLVAAGILALVMQGIMSTMAMVTTRTQQSNFRSNLDLIKQSLIAVIANQSAWDQTKRNARNSSMRCLNQGPCVNGRGGAFSLYDATGAPVFDAMDPSAGFDLNGQPCRGYSANGNDACPIRFDLTWAPSCNEALTPGSCRHPSELVSIVFRFSPNSANMKGAYAVNPLHYSVINQPRINLTSATPVVDCVKQNKVFIGQGNSFQGDSADAMGCIALSAFVGPTGATGATGAQGAQGPMGPQGPPGVCL